MLATKQKIAVDDFRPLVQLLASSVNREFCVASMYPTEESAPKLNIKIRWSIRIVALST